MSGLVTAKELREQRARSAEEARAMLDTIRGEDREFSAEERDKFDKIHEDQEALKRRIDDLEKQDALESELRATAGTVAGQADIDKESSKDEIEERARKYEAAFDRYLRVGVEDMTPDERAIVHEQRAQSVGTTTAGGFLVPEGFSGQLEESMLAFGGMREAATQFSTATGNDLPWPTVDDTSNTGALLAENTTVAEQDFTFGQIVFKAYKYSSKLVKVSVELLQDSAFDLNAYLATALGTRIGRITNTHFTTGTGTAQPQGVVTASSVGKTGTTGQTTSIIFDDLVDLEHSVDPAYRRSPGTRFMMHDSSLKVIKKLVDSQNRPLWLPGIAVKEPDTILSYPYVINQDVATMAANAKSVLFGDFSKYMIRNVAGLAVLRLSERFADSHQIGFLAFSRADGRTLDAGTDPIKHYANSAT